jgi:ABC-type sugar transport system ATPase subunit
MSDCILEVRDLEKEFSGTRVLKGVSLGFRRGEVHGLLGENGAGKSTLIKILTGVYGASAGEILLDGEVVRIHDPLAAHRLGLGAVYQDAELIGDFTVAENVLLGNEPGVGFVDRSGIFAEAKAIFDEIGIDIDVRRKARTLSAAEMQLVTLGTLFHRKYKVIILDEPTARLSGPEVELLFKIIQRFLAQGITIVYISHRLEEVKRICDRVTILRGGIVSATLDRDEISEERVTELMVDRSRKDLETHNSGHATDRVVLELRDLATEKLQPLSLQLHAGEIIGVTGPVGGGMEQLELALGGILQAEGTVIIDGEEVRIANPPMSRRVGVAIVPEDRRRQALFPNLTMAENVCLPVLSSLSRLGLVRGRLTNGYAEQVMQQLNVNPRSPGKAMKFFSGGNQQKAVIGKWLKANARIYVFVEPTAGVDVGAIKEIYDIIMRLAEDGAAVLVISSSTKEILSLADQVIVIRNGAVVHRARKADCDYDQILAISMGGRGTTLAA